jgi:uncharacterized membrane protein
VDEQTEWQAERERDLDRFLTFVDAIVAIAITLLVLPLVELTGDLGDSTVRDVLAEHQGQVGAFLLSFVVIARLWWAQHEAVRALVRMPRGFFVLMMAWTLTIVFLPFPTALVALTPGSDLTKLLYIGTTALSMAVLTLAELVVARSPGCTDSTSVPNPAMGAINTALLLVALVLALVVPGASFFPLLLLVLDNQVARLLHVDGRRPRPGRRSY